MANLADNLRYYVHHRLNNDPGWSKISVILSDANVPGEGQLELQPGRNVGLMESSL